jgi:YD repeat-containing protein
MKKQSLFLLVAAFFLVAACKKDETSSPTNNVPAEVSCLLTTMATNTGNVTSYYYDAQNRIVRTAAIGSGLSDSIIATYTYEGNVVTSRTPGAVEVVQKFFLNAAGFADSAVISVGAFGDIIMVRKYNDANQATELIMVGEIGGTEYDQESYMEYTNGNLTKQTTIDNIKSLSTISTMEYYMDKPNKVKELEERNNFTNANANLLKKVSNDDGTYTNYTYEFDTDGKVVKMMTVTDTNVESWNTYTWTCK